jgi:hypothetical protein
VSVARTTEKPSFPAIRSLGDVDLALWHSIFCATFVSNGILSVINDFTNKNTTVLYNMTEAFLTLDVMDKAETEDRISNHIASMSTMLMALRAVIDPTPQPHGASVAEVAKLWPNATVPEEMALSLQQTWPESSLLLRTINKNTHLTTMKLAYMRFSGAERELMADWTSASDRLSQCLTARSDPSVKIEEIIEDEVECIRDYSNLRKDASTRMRPGATAILDARAMELTRAWWRSFSEKKEDADSDDLECRYQLICEIPAGDTLAGNIFTKMNEEKEAECAQSLTNVLSSSLDTMEDCTRFRVELEKWKIYTKTKEQLHDLFSCVDKACLVLQAACISTAISVDDIEPARRLLQALQQEKGSHLLFVVEPLLE